MWMNGIILGSSSRLVSIFFVPFLVINSSFFLSLLPYLPGSLGKEDMSRDHINMSVVEYDSNMMMCTLYYDK